MDAIKRTSASSMASFYISAAHKSSGKTCVSVGLAGAMTNRGERVQTFKRGPDYIDPAWLEAASDKPCYNLDYNVQNAAEIDTLFTRESRPATTVFVEGSKGLFDGVDPMGTDSNAALAKLLSLPVVLVIDCHGMTRGIAPLLLGYQAFDEQVNFAGVILNKTGGSRHERKLYQAIENYTDIPVLGALPSCPSMTITERHLGLTPANEVAAAKNVVQRIAATVEAGIDLDAIMALGEQQNKAALPAAARTAEADVTIAVAKDAAFSFYYPDDLEAFTKAGAKLIFFDTLRDPQLPPCDGLFIGGGFPETHLQGLQGNDSMRRSIRDALQAGLPCYAECGGLMYLCQSIRYKGRHADMVGAITGSIKMSDTPQGRGLVKLQATGNGLWQGHAEAGAQFPAHEFHYAQLDGLSQDTQFAYAIRRGFGIDGLHDGIITGNCLASFSHLRNSSQTPWVPAFVQFVREHAR